MLIDDQFPTITLHQSARTLYPDADDRVRKVLPLLQGEQVGEITDVCFRLIDAGFYDTVEAAAGALKPALVAYCQ